MNLENMHAVLFCIRYPMAVYREEDPGGIPHYTSKREYCFRCDRWYKEGFELCSENEGTLRSTDESAKMESQVPQDPSR